jgi:hypothetical protein
MVRNYKRRSNQGKWGAENMEQAMKAVNSESMSLRKAAESFQVPKDALHRRLKMKLKPRRESESQAEPMLGRFRSVLSRPQEEELAAYILLMDQTFYGLTIKDICQIVYQFADRNRIPNTFNKELGLAGRDFVMGFLKRNPRLALRKPEPISINRIVGINRDDVNSYFTHLVEIVETNDFQGYQIYNCDESGLTNVHKPLKVITAKGKRTVASATSGERGTTTTIICAASATGMYVPPAMIFKRQRFKTELIDQAPTGTIGFCSKNGWIEADIFFEYVKHFVKHVKCTKNNPVLLILDGHSSHTKNLRMIDFARDHGLIVLSIPPHTSHKLQPLDRGLFKSLKSAYNAACTKWMRSHPGRQITAFQIGALFAEAYGKAATVENACSGFRAAGAWPVDPDIIQDYEFADKAGTEQTSEGQAETVSENSVPQNNLVPTTSRLALNTLQENSNENLSVSFEDIVSVPHVTTRRKTKRAERSEIITSSPYKKKIKANEVPNKNTSASCEIHNLEMNPSSSKETDDCECFACGESYSDSRAGESWLRCSKCEVWGHELCSSYSGVGIFTCDLCVTMNRLT